LAFYDEMYKCEGQFVIPYVGLFQAYSTPKEDPDLGEEEKRLILGGSVSKEPVTVIPWKLILSKAPVWALIVSHFCHNWGTFILLTWMPTYYNQVLTFSILF
jgi:ACS family sodium-dependent inorganic phosphate cotransporter